MIVPYFSLPILFQEELTEKITQLRSHKESNFKLTQGIEEAISKIETKNNQIEDLKGQELNQNA